MAASTGCSFSGAVFLLQNHYLRFRGAPSGFFKGCPQGRPSVDSGLGQPSTELKEVLDYSKTADQIVGCLHRFRKENPDADARLLTHDRGPMMAARSLELPQVPIKESWLLPPEQNEVEKENTRLKQRVAELEKSEPRFKMELIVEEGKTVEHLEADHLICEPLIHLMGCRVLTRIHRRTALGTALEEARGCSSESEIMVL